jgi:hypothetical protein
VWNPGDTQVAFAVQDDGADYEIWKIAIADPETAIHLTDNDDDDTAPTWGP